MTLLFLKLLLAHIIGDFVAQPKSWVKDKDKKRHRSTYLYLHILVHLGALLLILAPDIQSFSLGVLVILASHLIIDLIKVSLNKKADSRWLFIGDQLLHILVLIGVASFYQETEWSFVKLYSTEVILLLIALFSLTSVSSVIMRVLTSRWKFKENKSLKGAGTYIGILVRLFVFTFMYYNQWEAIGFLITAKSVFRFGDLSKAKDRKLTEYILIGTLLSFALAIAIGLFYQWASAAITH
ncbi:MAG: DUF3307 domain-containing protein [Marinoscillum sp.]